MNLFFFKNTKSITTRLGLFFLLVALFTGLFFAFALTFSLRWLETVIVEQHVRVEKNDVINYFKSAPQSGAIYRSNHTSAYNDLALVPKDIAPYLSGKTKFLGEINLKEDNSTFVYLDSYNDNGTSYPLILITNTELFALAKQDIAKAVTLVLAIFFVLTFIYGILFYGLIKNIIAPIHFLKNQLVTAKTKPGQHFSVPPEAVSEFQMMVAQLNDYITEINNLIKREQAFARYASHELRTPLTIIKGSLSLLDGRLTEPFDQRQVLRIQNGAEQISHIVDTLLSIVRYERNKNETPLLSLNEQSLKSVVEKHESLDKNINFTFNVSGEPQIKAFFIVFEMILGNLLRNAIAATEDGTIYISMTPTSLTVRDEGEGLLSPSNPAGCGLGLLIVEDLCTRHDWIFRLTNHPSKGCLAHIEFPEITP